jgi:hypothetical protein
LTLTLTDDDVIHRVVVPPGVLRDSDGDGVFSIDETSVGELRSLTFAAAGGGQGSLRVRSSEVDLSRAARGDHMVSVSLEIGAYRSTYTRLWKGGGRQLEPIGAQE